MTDIGCIVHEGITFVSVSFIGVMTDDLSFLLPGAAEVGEG